MRTKIVSIVSSISMVMPSELKPKFAELKEALRMRDFSQFSQLLEVAPKGILNAQDEKGKTLLMYSMVGFPKEFSLLLLERGADPNVQSAGKKETALIKYILWNEGMVDGQYDTLFIRLLELGASPAITNEKGWNSFTTAVFRNRTAVLDVLIHNFGLAPLLQESEIFKGCGMSQINVVEYAIYKTSAGPGESRGPLRVIYKAAATPEIDEEPNVRAIRERILDQIITTLGESLNQILN